ncbi:MAG: hypothetical protein ABIQ73_19580 [Acidimicrobiales bacterium]
MKPTTRATVTLAAIAMIAGLLGLIRANGSFTNRHGSDIGYGNLELHLMSFNRFGGLLSFVLGAMVLAGALRHQRLMVAVGALGFAAFTLQALIGARQIDGGNITGANPATLSFCLMMTIGLGVLTAYDQSPDADRSA